MQWSAVYGATPLSYVADYERIPMYDYRKMNSEERERVLKERRARGFPLHAPPHISSQGGIYLITGACFEHRPIFENQDDLSWLSNEVIGAFAAANLLHQGWVFLPNHYHVLVKTKDLGFVSEVIRLLHSRVATKITAGTGSADAKYGIVSAIDSFVQIDITLHH